MLREERKQNNRKCSNKARESRKRVEYTHTQRKKIKGNEQKIITNMVSFNPTVSIITLNVNGLYTPIKRQTIKVDYKETRPNYMLSTRNAL